jgi:hypothetical protein
MLGQILDGGCEGAVVMPNEPRVVTARIVTGALLQPRGAAPGRGRPDPPMRSLLAVPCVGG